MSKSTFSYFKAQATSGNGDRRVPVFGENSITGLNQREISSIVEEVSVASGLRPLHGSKKRRTYTEEKKLKIARYANMHTPSRAVKHVIEEYIHN